MADMHHVVGLLAGLLLISPDSIKSTESSIGDKAIAPRRRISATLQSLAGNPFEQP